MSPFAENLEIALSKKGYTHKEATQLLGVSKNVLSNYKKGQLPNANILMRIAELCDVSIDWLLMDKEHATASLPPESVPDAKTAPEPPPSPAPALAPEYAQLLEAMNALPEEARAAVCALVSAMSHMELDLAVWQKAPAPPPPEPAQEPPSEPNQPLAEKTSFAVPLFGLCAVGEPLDMPYSYNSVILGSVMSPYPEAILAVEIFGDSMEPEYPDGTILYIQPCQNLQEGQTAILSMENAVTCKRVRLDRKGRIMQLLPFNEKQEIVTLTPSRAEELKIIGTVIE